VLSLLRRVTLKHGQLMRVRHPTDTFRDLYMCARRNDIGVIYVPLWISMMPGRILALV
jgi:hypothetical protein